LEKLELFLLGKKNIEGRKIEGGGNIFSANGFP
jgi:hypothetical protein